MSDTGYYRKFFEDYLYRQKLGYEPAGLYDPVSYILSLGGKRLRPVLTLMAAEIFGADVRHALPAAMAVEVFHNFSLVHDDIMDDAPLRRGNATVHEKWNINTGILSGDAMLILAYQYFEQYDAPVFRDLAKLFSKTALEVCEGQQWDVDFEDRSNVTIAEYLKMIEYKTAVLVGAALKMGAIIAGTSEENGNAIYQFGRNLGIAFQLQDDYLDVFGDPEKFGKQMGGDIIENKKTHLYLTALEMSAPEQKKHLAKLYSVQTENNSEKIALVKNIFNETGAADASRKAITDYTLEAFNILGTMNIASQSKSALMAFGDELMLRDV